MVQLQDAVYATLVMTESYLPGAMVLGHSLRDRGTKARLVAFVLMEKLAQDTVSELKTVYDEIIPVQQIVNQQPANLYLMNRPDLISTFTKIELWKQTQYKRIVYLDADMVVIKPPNELLTMDTKFAAAPDVGWPDCFNSGLMVLNPNLSDYYSLLALAHRGISFDGADQGLLNMHFTEWERLSFVYNCTPNANYQYVPAYKYFQNNIKVLHFIGAQKPWTQGRDYRSSSGVYTELLGRWWAVYDAHYRRPEPVPQNQFTAPKKKVQDFVRGEETQYQPQYQPQQQSQTQNQTDAQSRSAPRRRSSSGYSITQPRPQPVPGIHYAAQQGDSSSQERPFTDQPTLEERLDREGYQPIPTVEQRRWSAPHVEWEPARQPPPSNSKPEAENFPTQQYEMSESRQLFEPPAKYPEPPKDMWYEVPAEKPQPAAPPRMIFPWEERAPKATRVFPRSREPTPPPQEEEEEDETFFDSTTNQSTGAEPTSQDSSRTQTQAGPTGGSSARKPSTSGELGTQDFAPARPPSPPRHVFPWESRAPKATRVFPQEPGANPPPNTSRSAIDKEPPAASEVEDALNKSIEASKSPDNPWDAFAQQTNKWDEDPEISRFMESFNRPRKAQVHVLHDNRSSEETGQGPPPAKERRTSLKLTDFPTEVERPSLPVTPAPIRRPTLWGSDEQQDQSLLPLAKGVPRQDEWVRRFTSQCLPDFPDPVLRDIGGVLHLTCQHCGRQNPIIKLEELQRKQSLILTGEDRMQGAKTPPRRQHPDSMSREEAIEAATRAMNVGSHRPKTPTKPILKEPSFEVFGGDDAELRSDSIIATAHMTATGSKSPTRFNPIVLEGEAASEANSYLYPEEALREETIPLNDTSSTASHHSSHETEDNRSSFTSQSTSQSTSGTTGIQSSFTSYSMGQTQSSSFTSQSTEDKTTSFNSAVTLPVAGDLLSPTSTA